MKVKSYKRRRPLRVAAIILFGILVTVFLYFGTGERKTDIKQKSPVQKFDKFNVSDIDYTHYNKGKKVFTIKSGKIIHRKRKVGPLTISPIKEIAMANVSIEINLDKHYSQNLQHLQHNQKSQNIQNTDNLAKRSDIFPLSFADILKETIHDEQLGFISQVEIRGFGLKVLQTGQEQFTIAAKKVTLGLTSQKVLFRDGFSLISVNGERLIARKAQWVNKRKSLYIKGAYELRDEKGTTTGSKAYFTIDSNGKIKKV